MSRPPGAPSCTIPFPRHPRARGDALRTVLLRNRAPDRFAADALNGPDAATLSELERMKREWRKEWEAEAKAKREAESGKILDQINHRLARMSPTLPRRLRSRAPSGRDRDYAGGDGAIRWRRV